MMNHGSFSLIGRITSLVKTYILQICIANSKKNRIFAPIINLSSNKETSIDMEQYVIYSIDDNKGGSDGHVIIVKANPVKESPGFAHLTKLFGKKYYNYSMNETDETEMFVFPFSEERMQELIDSAKDAEENHNFWNPDPSEFYDANILMDGNNIRPIHKHISFKQEDSESPSGIQEVVHGFQFSNSLSGLFKEGAEKLSEVKNVPMNEGCVYTGKALYTGNFCMPNGFGYKVYKSEGNKHVTSFFRGTGTGNIARVMYPKKYMYIGGVFDGVPNGWGFKLSRGQFTFGYYKEGKLYKDLSPFATDVFYSIREKGIDLGHIEEDVNRLAFGLLPNENRPFTGFQFLEDGTVYIGWGSNNNEYNLTGRYLRLDIDGKATFGQFLNCDVEKQMTQDDYFKRYMQKGIGAEKTNLKSNYLAKADSGLYLVVSMQSSYDLDMGSIMFVFALPFDSIKTLHNGNINFDTSDLEYFCFWRNDDVMMKIKESAEKQRLWKVNLDDFNNHYGPVPDMDSDEPIERNFHIHNQLIGLEYSSFTVFDTVNVSTRLDEREFFGKNDFNPIDDDDDDELPF